MDNNTSFCEISCCSITSEFNEFRFSVIADADDSSTFFCRNSIFDSFLADRHETISRSHPRIVGNSSDVIDWIEFEVTEFVFEVRTSISNFIIALDKVAVFTCYRINSSITFNKFNTFETNKHTVVSTSCLSFEIFLDSDYFRNQWVVRIFNCVSNICTSDTETSILIVDTFKANNRVTYSKSTNASCSSIELNTHCTSVVLNIEIILWNIFHCIPISLSSLLDISQNNWFCKFVSDTRSRSASSNQISDRFEFNVRRNETITIRNNQLYFIARVLYIDISFKTYTFSKIRSRNSEAWSNKKD